MPNKTPGCPILKPIDYIHTSNGRAKRFSVLDLETTIRNRGENAVGTQKASPHHPDNVAVYWGITEPQFVINVLSETFFSPERRWVFSTADKHTFYRHLMSSNLVVGQNIKFDFLYMLYDNYDMVCSFFKHGGLIWDTMIVEYLLTNQQSQFAPLSNKYKTVPHPTQAGQSIRKLVVQGLAEKYGGSSKDDRIAEYWENGIDTPEIPVNEITTYAADDLKNTSIVFREQYRLAMQRGPAFMNLIYTQMEALVATTFMEFHGMRFDLEKCAPKAKVLAKQYDTLATKIATFMSDEFNAHAELDWPTIDSSDVNPNSNQQIATFMFGGTFKYRRQMPVLDEEGFPTLYVTGKKKGTPKYRWEEFQVIIPPENAMFHEERHLAPRTPSGAYQVDDATLRKCKRPGKIDNIVDTILEYRKIDKDLNTYYLGLMALVWPTDGCIHGNINHCSTTTGRTSSSAPNMQNVSG